MNDSITEYRNRDCRTPTNVRLLLNPIDFIAEDHLRLRAMCTELDRLAEAEPQEPDAMAEMQDYLTHELPALLDDEDVDLMPMVLARADPEDELPKLASRLAREHREIDRIRTAVRACLATYASGDMDCAGFPQTLRSLAQAARRHLIFENAVLLPLARARLTHEDLIALRQAMLRRRGLQDVFGG
jgi:iron-sulfur cluster repair protein YtfE (RIC family)